MGQIRIIRALEGRIADQGAHIETLRTQLAAAEQRAARVEELSEQAIAELRAERDGIMAERDRLRAEIAELRKLELGADVPSRRPGVGLAGGSSGAGAIEVNREPPAI